MSSRFLADFAKEIQKYGDASEGEPRHLIRDLLSGLSPDVDIRHEPGRIDDEGNAPDFIAERNGNAVGYVEHKKVSVDIRNMKNKNNREQQERYRRALSNLIYTNGVEWDFYRDGALVNETPLRVDRLDDREELEERLTAFVDHAPDPISDPQKLAEKIAGKTTLLRIALLEKLKNGKSGNREIQDHYDLFKDMITHDESKENFAKFYAETITYGMFAARMNAPDKKFTRRRVTECLPKNNPFLCKLFHYISGRELDSDIDWIIDDLADLLSVCEVAELMKRFTKVTGKEDPFLHFYETFLEAYDPERRRKDGVYYTPRQAVQFIVRAVDRVLMDELGIEDGLADTTTVSGTGEGEDMHRVRVLDPATGTGTFLVEVIREIAPRIKRQMESASSWTRYIEDHLIPRLHGFENSMAPHAMCFTKIDMALKALDYDPSDDPVRLEVYLTDALDLGTEHPQFPHFRFLTEEADLAGEIKDGDKPVMCVIGNPPYNSKAPAPNKESMMGTLLDDYKKEPGKDTPLEERTKGHLNDLYLQFMRLSSHLVERNCEGGGGNRTHH